MTSMGDMMGGGTMMQANAGTVHRRAHEGGHGGGEAGGSGVQMTEMQPLVDRLAASTGAIQ
jgi:hypothetical protein